MTPPLQNDPPWLLQQAGRTLVVTWSELVGITPRWQALSLCVWCGLSFHLWPKPPPHQCLSLVKGSPEGGWTGIGHHHHQKTVSSFSVHMPMVPLLAMKVSFLSGSAVSQKMRTKHSLRSSRDGDKLSHWPLIKVDKLSIESDTSLESLSLSAKGFFFLDHEK